MKHINIEISNNLHRALKGKAFKEDTTQKDIITKALEKYVGIGGKK